MRLMKSLFAGARRLTACSPYFESILHKACRWSSSATVLHLISRGANPSLQDDRGRLPLHDACWREVIDFGVIAVLLRHDVNMLRQLDAHGFSPLAYMRREQWLQMCLFLFQFADIFWPRKESK